MRTLNAHSVIVVVENIFLQIKAGDASKSLYQNSKSVMVWIEKSATTALY